MGLGVVACFTRKAAGGRRCTMGSRQERGPCVLALEEMLLWGGKCDVRAGDKQPEMGLGGDLKRDFVLRVP